MFCVCFGCYLTATAINTTATVAILCGTGCALATFGVWGFLLVRKKQMRRALLVLAGAFSVQLVAWLSLTLLAFSDGEFVVEVCAAIQGGTYLLCLLGSVTVLLKKQRLLREKQKRAEQEREARNRLQLQLEQSKQARHLSERAAKVLALHLRSVAFVLGVFGVFFSILFGLSLWNLWCLLPGAFEIDCWQCASWSCSTGKAPVRNVTCCLP
jgi:Ca2+/Na+ antiporter